MEVACITNIKMTLKKFLAIAFMCHQRPERSFHFKGKQFPLCARCTGILIGYFLGIAIAIITRCENYLWYLLLLVPATVDGGIQQFFKIASNNKRRLITGIMAGIGIIYVFISVHFFTVWWVTMVLIKLK